MTDNELLARWQGLDSHECDPHSFHCDDCARGSIRTPDYPNDEAATVSLLMTAISRGWRYKIEGSKYYSSCKLYKVPEACEYREVGYYAEGDILHEAIIAAVLEVAKRELGADESASLEVARKEQGDEQ